MVRKIGEVFELDGRKLKVEEAKLGYCDDCYLLNGNCLEVKKVTGECVFNLRNDETDVIFKDITDEESK